VCGADNLFSHVRLTSVVKVRTGESVTRRGKTMG